MYAQIQNDTYVTEFDDYVQIVWDDNNYCTAPALVRDGKADQFGVVTLHPTDPPAHSPATHKAVRDGAEFVAGQWQYKWLVVALSAEELAAATEQFKQQVVDATQARLDAFAKTRGYDGVLSAASYAVSTHPPFAAEGRYCADARDATWGALYTLMAEVLAGTRAMPTGFAEVEAVLPALVWPA